MIEAYKFGTISIIDQVKLTLYIPFKIISIKFEYKLLKIIQNILKEYNCIIENSTYSDIVLFDLKIPVENFKTIKNQLIEKTK